MKILSCNVGSSSLKIRLYDMPEEKLAFKLRVERIGTKKAVLHIQSENQEVSHVIPVANHLEAVALALISMVKNGAIVDLEELDAVGFKAVHAGPLSKPTLISAEVMKAMEAYMPVAPLHNRIYLDSIRAFEELVPQLKRVAVFEPFFHRHMPQYVYTYAVPFEWYEKYSIRKYGFHGASHGYIARRTPEIIGNGSRCGRIISCHLGGSSSVCAIRDGISIDTSMGFSPQSGIAMGTRNGDLDAYVLLFLQEKGYTPAELNDALFNQSGLKGISGISEDIRDIEDAAAGGNTRAQLALDIYAYDVKRYIGAYLAVLGGADAIVFTGGIGENAAKLRVKILEGFEYCGIHLDLDRNAANVPETCISTEESNVGIYMIPTNEEIVVARETLRVLQTDY